VVASLRTEAGRKLLATWAATLDQVAPAAGGG
jgi:hypothetical protein